MSEPRTSKVLLQLAAIALLAMQALVAVGWMLVNARGFAVTHPFFWANVGLPLLLLAASVAGVVGPKRLVQAILLALPVGWAAAALATLILFPKTGAPVAFVFGAGALLTGALAAGVVGRPESPRAAVPILLLAAAAGVAAPLCQRAPAPTTRPAPVAMEPGSPVFQRTANVGRLQVTLHPGLTFVSTSPDRFWTLFARASSFAPDCAERDFAAPDGQLALEVRCQLDEPAWSHLNHWLRFEVTGHTDLGVSFSPMPDVVVPVQSFDYPVGRPATFAWLGDDGLLHLSRARSAEKGPFTELGSGPLARDEPLVITLHDAGVPVVDIELADFVAQASTAPSPTAGWGVAQNAIEFARVADYPDATGTFWITLAATSVGRGFQSVGHAPGVYRNRLTVRARLGR